MITENIFIFTLYFLPFQFALNIGDNIDLVVTRVLVPALFLSWLLRGLAKKNIWVSQRAETLLVASFLFLCLLSLVFGQDAGMGLRKALFLFSIFPIFFVGADLLRKEKIKMRAVWAIVISGTVAAAIALAQFFLQFAIGLEPAIKISREMAPFFLGRSFGKLVAANPSWLVNVSGETWMRAFGLSPDPHVFSVFASLAFFVAIGYAAWKKEVLAKIAVFLGAAIMLAAIILSFSRGAYLGLATGILFFAFFLLKRSGHLGKVLAAAGAIAVVLAAINFQVAVNRLKSTFNFREGSNVERLKNWGEAIEVIRDYPLSGVGMGNYSHLIDPTADERSSIYAHNLFLDIAAETGILNSLVFLFLILVSIWRGIGNRDMISLGIASGLVYFLTHSLFDTSIWAPQVAVMLLVILAIGLYGNNIKMKDQNGK